MCFYVYMYTYSTYHDYEFYYHYDMCCYLLFIRLEYHWDIRKFIIVRLLDYLFVSNGLLVYIIAMILISTISISILIAIIYSDHCVL